METSNLLDQHRVGISPPDEETAGAVKERIQAGKVEHFSF